MVNMMSFDKVYILIFLLLSWLHDCISVCKIMTSVYFSSSPRCDSAPLSASLIADWQELRGAVDLEALQKEIEMNSPLLFADLSSWRDAPLHVDGSSQNWGFSSALALEMPQACFEPLMCCQAVISPMHQTQQWRYHSLALNHKYVVRLWCLQCISNGDTTALHWAIDMCN